MGLGVWNEVIAVGMVLAGIRYLNIGLIPSGGAASSHQVSQENTYLTTAEFAKGGGPLSGRALEICAGFGAGLKRLQGEASWQLEGMEGGRICSWIARRRGVPVNYALLERLPYEANSFDHVLGVESIVCLDQPEEGMREISRILKPGGSLTIAEFRLGSVERSEKILRRLGKGAGLTLVELKDITPDARRSVLDGAAIREGWVKRIPRPFRNWAMELAALPGSVRYQEWDAGKRCYYLARFEKPE